MFFRSRETKKEIMDDHTIIDERMVEALKELEVINKYLGGISSTREGFKLFANGKLGHHSLKVLDLGSGFSDVLKSYSKGKLNIVHLDINAGILKELRDLDKNADCICGDAAAICLKEKSIDIIHLSLFLHHISNKQLKSVLADIIRTARVGIIINDLRRNILAYAGIKLLTLLFSKSEMVRNDGPLSVKKGFTKKEIETLLDNFKVEYIIKRKWAFRWLVCVYL